MNEAQLACPRCKDGVAWHAALHVGHVWTNMSCPAYRTDNGDDCVCQS